MPSWRPTPLCLAVALVLVLGPLGAQTFTVDPANGPGTSFTSLTTAIATVPSGSILVCRTGTYAPFTIDQKDLTIVADGTASVGNIGQGCTIRNLQANQQVTLRGLRITGGVTNSFVRCIDNAGSVVIDSCDGFGTFPTSGATIEAVRSADVHIHRGTWAPAIVPLLVIDSQVRVSSATLTVTSFYAGVAAFDSTVELVDCSIIGSGFGPGRAAISLNNSSLRIMGVSSVSSTLPWPAIDGIGTARIGPNVTFFTGGPPAIAAQVSPTFLDMPNVQASVDTTTGVATATLRGPGNGIGVLFAALTGTAQMIAPFTDPIVLLPGTETQMAAGGLAAQLMAGYTLPALPALRGLRVTWQGASLDAVLGAQISNAVSYAHF